MLALISQLSEGQGCENYCGTVKRWLQWKWCNRHNTCAQKHRQQKVPPARVISACPGSDTQGRRVWNSWGGEVTGTAGQTGEDPSGLWASCLRHRPPLWAERKHTLWRILHPFMKPLPYVQLCLVRKACQHNKKKKKMGENWTHEKMLHQTGVSLALVISTAIADPIC